MKENKSKERNGSFVINIPTLTIPTFTVPSIKLSNKWFKVFKSFGILYGTLSILALVLTTYVFGSIFFHEVIIKIGYPREQSRKKVLLQTSIPAEKIYLPSSSEFDIVIDKEIFLNDLQNSLTRTCSATSVRLDECNNGFSCISMLTKGMGEGDILYKEVFDIVKEEQFSTCPDIFYTEGGYPHLKSWIYVYIYNRDMISDRWIVIDKSVNTPISYLTIVTYKDNFLERQEDFSYKYVSPEGTPLK